MSVIAAWVLVALEFLSGVGVVAWVICDRIVFDDKSINVVLLAFGLFMIFGSIVTIVVFYRMST